MVGQVIRPLLTMALHHPFLGAKHTKGARKAQPPFGEPRPGGIEQLTVAFWPVRKLKEHAAVKTVHPIGLRYLLDA